MGSTRWLSFSATLLLVPGSAWSQGATGQRAPPACASNEVSPGFSGDLSLGGSLTRSSIDEDKLTVAFTTAYYPGKRPCVVPRWRTLVQVLLDLGAKAKSGDPKVVTRNLRADVQQMRILGGGKTFLAATGRLRHNNAQGVDLQQQYAITGGVRMPSLAGLEIDLGAGWTQLKLSDSAATGFAGIALSQSATVAIPIPKLAVTVVEGTKAFLTLEDAGRNRVEVFGAIIVQIAAGLGMAWNLWFDYLEAAPTGSQSEYLNTALTIKLTF